MGAAQQVYEEGLYIPITKIVDKGEINQWLVDLIAANVREPVQVIGDIYSLISSNEVGGRRLVAMMDEFEPGAALDDLAKHILDHSREASLEAIDKLPPGTYHNDDDGRRHQRQVDGRSRPSSPSGPRHRRRSSRARPAWSQLGINVPLCYTEAYTSFGVKCIVAPHVPNNAASLATIRVTAPEGCILNAKHPAPVAARAIDRPDAARRGVRLPASGAAAGRARRRHVVPVERATDGRHGPGRWRSGAARQGDAVQRHVLPFRRHRGAAQAPTGCRRPPSRAAYATCRSRSPRRSRPCWSGAKEYRTDSGGAGEYRGGLGPDDGGRQRRGHAVRHLDLRSTAWSIPPRGRAGGKPGATGRVELASGKTLAPKAHSSDPGRRAPAGSACRAAAATATRTSARAGEGGGGRGARTGLRCKPPASSTAWRSRPTSPSMPPRRNG